MNAFELDAPRVMGELCAAVSQLLAECGCTPRGTDVAERLAIDKMLAWHLAQIARSDNPLLVAHHVPGTEGMKLCLQAAAKAGASRIAIDRLQEVFLRYQRLKSDHAGDQQRLDSMLASTVGRLGDARSLESARAAAFRANSIIFGLASAIHFKTDFIAPHVDGESLDFCSLIGTVQLARFRADATWEVSRSSYIDERRPADLHMAGPLDPDAYAEFNMPLLRAFSSTPPVPFAVYSEGGLRHSRYLNSGELGLCGRLTFIFGEYARGVGHRYAQTPGEHGDVFTRLYTPSELMLHDLLIHNDLLRTAWAGMVPQWILIGELGCGLLFPAGADRKVRIPVPRLEHAGPAAATPTVPRYPRYLELLHHAAERMGWSLTDFTLFRAKLKFPPIPATNVLRLLLPVRPAALPTT